MIPNAVMVSCTSLLVSCYWLLSIRDHTLISWTEIITAHVLVLSFISLCCLFVVFVRLPNSGYQHIAVGSNPVTKHKDSSFERKKNFLHDNNWSTLNKTRYISGTSSNNPEMSIDIHGKNVSNKALQIYEIFIISNILLERFVYILYLRGLLLSHFIDYRSLV